MEHWLSISPNLTFDTTSMIADNSLLVRAHQQRRTDLDSVYSASLFLLNDITYKYNISNSVYGPMCVVFSQVG